MDSPSKTLARAASTAPARALPGQLARCQQSKPPLSPRVPTPPTNYIGTKAREAPLWWHEDLRQDHEHTRSDEDQKTATLGGSLVEESYKTPGKILAGDDCAPWQDPCRGHLRGHSQAHVCQDPTAVPMQPPAQPAGQAPAWQRAASRPTQQAPAWWHADLREDPTTTPSQQPASLRGAACLVGLDACRSKAERRRTGRASLPPPIKQVDT